MLPNDEGIAGRVKQLRSDSFKIECRDDLAGYNSLLGEMLAAFLRAKLGVLDEWNVRCREIATQYSTLLAGVDIDLPLIPEYTESVRCRYVIRSKHRDTLKAHLDQQGVTTVVHYPIPPIGRFVVEILNGTTCRLQ